MRKLYTLTNIINNDFDYKEYLSPNFVFVPIDGGLKRQVTLNENVLKTEYISSNSYCSISGLIKGSKICNDLNSKIKTIAVANDYKETKNKAAKMSKDVLFESLVDKNILDKLKGKETNLIYSAFSDELNIFNNWIIIKNHSRDILNLLSYLKNKYNFQNIYVIVKDIDKKNIESFINIIGNYPEIKLITVPNIYPINNTDYFKEFLKIDDYCCLNQKDVYKMVYLFNHKSKMCEKYITINKDDSKSLVINVKMGALVSELFEEFKIDLEGYNIFLNGLIGKIPVKSLANLIVTDSLDAIFITKNCIKEPSKCINCGNCLKYCPVNINPKYIMDKKNIPDKFKNKCIKCGLCSYICPSNIDLLGIIESCDKNETTQ